MLTGKRSPVVLFGVLAVIALASSGCPSPSVQETLTYTAGAGGTISGASPQTVNYGATGTAVTAAPNPGCHFISWSDGVITAARTDTNATANVSVTATFAVNAYTLTYTAATGGTISGASPQTVNYGASGAAVTAVANNGYNFVSWSDGSTQNPRTDADVAASVSVTATFVVNAYTLTYTAATGGTISGASPQTVNYDVSGTPVTATPNIGFHFISWNDGALTAARADTNVTANVSVTATFAVNAYTLTYAAGAGGTISGISPQTVNYGASGTTVTAVPDTGCQFLQWSDGSTENPRVDLDVTTDISVTANFSAIEITIGSGTGAAGNTVSVPVTLTAGSPGPAVIVMTIVFDNQLLSFSAAAAGDAIISAGKTLATSEPAAGQVRIIIYSGVTAMASGNLFNIEFNILDGNSGEVIPLAGSNGSAADAQANSMLVIFQNGQVQVQ